MRTSLLAVLLLGGCAALTGKSEAERPATLQFARYKTEGIVKERAIHLRQVDGKPVGGRRPTYTEEIELAPGDHTIKFYLYDSDGSGPGVPGQLTLTASEGGRYLVNFEQSEIRVKSPVWIEDRITGQVVGGRAPGADKPASPSAEAAIPRADWKTIPGDKVLKIYMRSGGTHSGNLIGVDGDYLWFQLTEGRRKALLLAEIDKISGPK